MTEDERLIAAEKYRAAAAHNNRAMALQGDHGKWLIASLFLINAGATVALLSAGDRTLPLLQASGWWFTSGLVAAVLCGFATWINWSLHAIYFDKVYPVKMLIDAEWPKHDKKLGAAINVSFWVSIVIGLGSLGLFVAGAVAVAAALSAA